MAKKRSNSTIGIDIGTTSIKVVKASRRGSSYIVNSAHEYFFNQDIMRDGLPQQDGLLGMHVQQALVESGGGKSVAMAVPTNTIMTSIAMVDSRLKDSALFNNIETNLSRYIPLPADEVMVDCQIISQVEDDPNTNEVLVVGTNREYVNSRMYACEDAELDLTLIDVDIYALTTLLSIKYDFSEFTRQEVIIFIEVGVFRTGFFVLKSDGTVEAREMPMGGERLTELIADEMNIPIEKAEALKRGATREEVSGVTNAPAGGQTENWDNNPVLNKCKEVFITEASAQIQSTLYAYQTNNPQFKVRQVFLTGGGTLVPGFIETLSAGLSMEVERINPQDIIEFSAAIPHPEKFSIATGLAIRSML